MPRPQCSASQVSPEHRSPVTVLKNGIVSALRFQIGERGFQRLRRRLHQRMMKWMIDPHEPRKRALRLEFGGHRFERNARPRKRDRTRSVERGNRHRPVVPRDQRQRFLLAQTDREHGAFAARAFLHETRAQHDNPRRFFHA